MAKKECSNCKMYQKLWQDERDKRYVSERQIERDHAEALHYQRLFEYERKRADRLRQMTLDYAEKQGAARARMEADWKFELDDFNDAIAGEGDATVEPTE